MTSFENNGLAKPGISVSEKWPKSSLERVLKVLFLSPRSGRRNKALYDDFDGLR
jgi:hypothetical protein